MYLDMEYLQEVSRQFARGEINQERMYQAFTECRLTIDSVTISVVRISVKCHSRRIVPLFKAHYIIEAELYLSQGEFNELINNRDAN